jgi:hypothetical protein
LDGVQRRLEVRRAAPPSELLDEINSETANAQTVECIIDYYGLCVRVILPGNTLNTYGCHVRLKLFYGQK